MDLLEPSRFIDEINEEYLDILTPINENKFRPLVSSKPNNEPSFNKLRFKKVTAKPKGNFKKLKENSNKSNLFDSNLVVGNLVEHIRFGKGEVINIEGTDVREVSLDIVKTCDIITIDLSFISLKKAIQNIVINSKSDTLFYILFKPQFEVGRAEIHKNGIVKNEILVWDKLLEFKRWLIDQSMDEIKLFKSPILGKDGNQEWLFFGRKYDKS